MNSWCSMGTGLLSAIRYLLNGQFAGSDQTFDCCESILRYMMALHQNLVVAATANTSPGQFDPSTSLHNAVDSLVSILEALRQASPSFNGDDAMMEIGALLCWVTLANVLLPESYLPEPNGSTALLSDLDASQVPLRLRNAIAYARGLVEETLDCFQTYRDPDSTLRETLFLPMLLDMTLLMRSEFSRRFGDRESEKTLSGFWGSPARRKLFHSQLDAVIERCLDLDDSDVCADLFSRESIEGIELTLPMNLTLQLVPNGKPYSISDVPV